MASRDALKPRAESKAMSPLVQSLPMPTMQRSSTGFPQDQRKQSRFLPAFPPPSKWSPAPVAPSSLPTLTKTNLGIPKPSPSMAEDRGQAGLPVKSAPFSINNPCSYLTQPPESLMEVPPPVDDEKRQSEDNEANKMRQEREGEKHNRKDSQTLLLTNCILIYRL